MQAVTTKISQAAHSWGRRRHRIICSWGRRSHQQLLSGASRMIIVCVSRLVLCVCCCCTTTQQHKGKPVTAGPSSQTHREARRCHHPDPTGTGSFPGTPARSRQTSVTTSGRANTPTNSTTQPSCNGPCAPPWEAPVRAGCNPPSHSCNLSSMREHPWLRSRQCFSCSPCCCRYCFSAASAAAAVVEASLCSCCRVASSRPLNSPLFPWRVG